MCCIFTAHFAQHSSMFGKFFDIPAFFSMRNSDGTITYFHITDAIILANLDIIVELVADQKGFKQSAAKINGNIIER